MDDVIWFEIWYTYLQSEHCAMSMPQSVNWVKCWQAICAELSLMALELSDCIEIALLYYSDIDCHSSPRFLQVVHQKVKVVHLQAVFLMILLFIF